MADQGNEPGLELPKFEVINTGDRDYVSIVGEGTYSKGVHTAYSGELFFDNEDFKALKDRGWVRRLEQ